MTRISRLRTPRASLSALALLAAYMLAFHVAAALGHGHSVLATSKSTAAEASDGLPTTVRAAARPDSALATPRLLPCELGLAASTHTEDQR